MEEVQGEPAKRKRAKRRPQGWFTVGPWTASHISQRAGADQGGPAEAVGEGEGGQEGEVN